MKNELKELLAQCTPYSANRKWKASVHPDYTMRLYSGKKQICIAPMEDANPSMQVSDFDLLARAPALARRVIELEEILQKWIQTGTGRCDSPVIENITPTKYAKEERLHDCGKCLYCQTKKLLGEG